MDSLFPDLLTAPPRPPDAGSLLGRSREGRPVLGHRFGGGGLRISLVAGCHADEPVGPRLLRHLVGFLSGAPDNHPLMQGKEWWIVPHANPDGEARNRAWYGDQDEAYHLGRYLAGAVRELPGDDMEFGFPRDDGDGGARPENQALARWWSTAPAPFHLHGSLHGMGFAAGPWFLVEPGWTGRLQPLMDRLTRRVGEMGYALHDVERMGEKGFHRLARGFATRPDSRAMAGHFLERGDPETARLFRPSSMEAIRGLGGDPLTLVTEMPLFLTPGVGVELGPPDPAGEKWKERIHGWRERLARGEDPDAVAREADAEGLRPMPVRDQMELQWAFLAAAIFLAGGGSDPGAEGEATPAGA